MDGDSTNENCVRQHWEEMCGSALGRSFLRSVVVPYFQRLNRSMTVTSLMIAQAGADASDVVYALASDELRNDLHVLLAIERCNTSFLCSPLRDEHPPLRAAVTDALEINFFARTFLLSLRWYEEMSRRSMQSEWAIPPIDTHALRSWHVAEDEFLRRLGWIAPWLRRFLRHPAIREHGIVLSGGLLPLCVLRQEVFVEDADSFMRYADEIYRNTSIDLFVTGEALDIDAITDDVCAVLASVDQPAVRVATELWVEDDDAWVRARRGTSVSLDMESGRRIVLVFMASRTSAIAHQHLPCVRASYDGSTLSVTASCYVSWMTRFIGEPLLFGHNVSAARRSKTVLKYAIRGFGFSPAAIAGCTLPSTISLWLREEVPRHRSLPWYYILYHPSLWRKAMTAQRERDLLACIES